GAQIFNVFTTSVTANCDSLAGVGGSEGYELDPSLHARRSSDVGSSSTASVSQTTLTVTGLAANTTYFFRVGGINWNNVINYTTIGSTLTNVGSAPVNPAVSSVFITSITANWATVANTTGYDIEA